MATSRGGTPANPTLVATTDDEARGGLFARSNNGNLLGSSPTTATDTHVSNVVFDDTSRMLTVTLNNGTTYTAEIPGGGSNTGPTTDTHLQSVAFDPTTRQLSFTLTGGGTISPVTIPAGTIDAQTLANAIAEYFRLNPITESFTDLTDTPSSFPTGSAGNVIVVNSTENGLEFGTPSSISQNDFVDNQAMIFSNATDGSGRIAARVAPMDVSTDVNGTTLRLVVNNQGLFSLSTSTTPVTPEPRGTVNTPAPTNILSTPRDETVTINIDDVMDIGTNPTVTVTGPGNTPITPTVTVNQPVGNTEMGSVEVTIPAADGADPGNYEVDASIPTTDTAGNPMTVNEMATVMRFVPFVQSRIDMSTEAQLQGGTISTAAFNPMTGLTVSLPGSNSDPIFLAIDNAAFPVTGNRAFADALGFPSTLRVLRQVTATAGSQTITYNIFQVNAQMGAMLTNFRTTR